MDFKELYSIDVSKYIEKKDGLTYLSWSYAWAEIMKKYPDSNYRVIKNENGLPYFSDDFGIIVFTEVTINGITREMWLPVMDGRNKAMKKESYVYTVYDKYSKKNTEKKVEAASMFDINKTIMRCLVKNIAMFGLGLYIYNGEDIPEIDVDNAIDEGIAKLDQELEPNLMIVEIKDLARTKELPENIAAYFENLDMYNSQYNAAMHEKNKKNLSVYKNKGE